MIIYGTQSKELARERLAESCPECNQANTVDLFIYQRYAHVFWIPFFPLGKTIVSQCQHCRQILKQKDQPVSWESSRELLKSKVSTPAWTFSGIALIAIAVTFGLVQEQRKQKRNADLIQHPAKGDVFEIKTREAQYTLYKVEEIEGDSVVIRINRYETDKQTGLPDLKSKGAEAYLEDLYVLAQADLKDMFNKGEILDIDRK